MKSNFFYKTVTALFFWLILASNGNAAWRDESGSLDFGGDAGIATVAVVAVGLGVAWYFLRNRNNSEEDQNSFLLNSQQQKPGRFSLHFGERQNRSAIQRKWNFQQPIVPLRTRANVVELRLKF